MKFSKIFGDHKHNVNDIQSEIGPGHMIIAYQVDPNAIDADKIANYQYNGEEHLLKFP